MRRSVCAVQSDQFQFALPVVERTSSPARLQRSEDVCNDDVSNEGNDNEQSANSYLWKKVAVYFKITYEHSPTGNEEPPEDDITKGTPIKIGQKNNRTSRKV